MFANPLRRIKDRLTAAIDWRAREAARVDEAVMGQLGSTVADLSAELSRQVALLRSSVEDLNRRLEAVERRSQET